jgi:shikimate kinase
MNIILMGYRCTGKTTTGWRLAERMGMPFYDTDELVERQTQRTIPQIVAENGWPAFREAEMEVIRNLSGADHSIIALGGGAVLDSRNVENLKRNGVFIWLFAVAETIVTRMEKDAAVGAERPSLTGRSSVSEINAVMVEREPLYRRLADLVVDTSRIDSDQVAMAIMTGLQERLLQGNEITAGKEK